MAEGSYRELQSSGLDFTKLLGSSEESPSSPETCNANAMTDDDTESFSVISLNGSTQSVSSSVDGIPLKNGTRAEPVEVAETRSSGNVSRRVYLSYISSGGNVSKISFLMFVCIFTQTLVTGCDYWITYW